MKIAIAGGGIIGKLLAFSLVNCGFTITLFEKKETTCSMIAAGLLSPIAELDKTQRLIYELGKKSLQLWPAILSEIQGNIYFQLTGSLLLAHTYDLPELDRVIQRIAQQVPEKKFSKISTPQFSSGFQQGYFLEEEGQIDSQNVLQILQMYLLKKNVTIIEENIKKISPHRILIGNSSMHFDWVCDCRGLGAKTFFPLLRGIRGELIWVKAPKVSIDKPLRILHPRYHLYIVPRPNDQYILGASEIESEDFSEISVRSTLEFLTLAFAIHTGFSEARILQTFTHCRPTLQHHLPEIQYTKGLVAINGLYRHGFLLAPILAHEVSQYISENISPQFSQIWNPYYDENIIEPK